MKTFYTMTTTVDADECQPLALVECLPTAHVAHAHVFTLLVCTRNTNVRLTIGRCTHANTSRLCLALGAAHVLCWIDTLAVTAGGW